MELSIHATARTAVQGSNTMCQSRKRVKTMIDSITLAEIEELCKQAKRQNAEITVRITPDFAEIRVDVDSDNSCVSIDTSMLP